jgi:hypothetical protein
MWPRGYEVFPVPVNRTPTVIASQAFAHRSAAMFSGSTCHRHRTSQLQMQLLRNPLEVFSGRR